MTMVDTIVKKNHYYPTIPRNKNYDRKRDYLRGINILDHHNISVVFTQFTIYY